MASFKYIISVDPPLGTQDGVLMAVWTIGLWLTFFTGVFAINANAWLSLVGVLPLGGVAVLLPCWHRQRLATRHLRYCLCLLLLIIWLSWRLLNCVGRGRWISALIIVARCRPCFKHVVGATGPFLCCVTATIRR